jgi:hypothetical protein
MVEGGLTSDDVYELPGEQRDLEGAADDGGIAEVVFDEKDGTDGLQRFRHAALVIEGMETGTRVARIRGQS